MPQASRVQTASVSELLPGVTVSFQSKPPHSRFDVVFSSPVGQEISGELSSALHATGFNHQRKLPQRNGVVSRSFEREGSGTCRVGQREQLRRVLRLDTSRHRGSAPTSAACSSRSPTSARMNAIASCACSGVATPGRADRPDRLVRDHHLGEALGGTTFARSSWTCWRSLRSVSSLSRSSSVSPTHRIGTQARPPARPAPSACSALVGLVKRWRALGVAQHDAAHAAARSASAPRSRR